MQLTKIEYKNLNAKQQESYNFQKVSAVLAEYGFSTIRLSDDWQGADFIAQHLDGNLFLKVQLKGRFTVDKKYVGKDIYICFNNKDIWYLYPHDEVLDFLLTESNLGATGAWLNNGTYSYPSLSKKISLKLNQYII